MAIVIDGLKLVESKRRLPKEAFFVDTNVVIDFKDPFGRSNDDSRFRSRHQEISQVVSQLKASKIVALSSLGVLLEYYKYIQVGFYQARTGNTKFDLSDFKKLRGSDIGFMNSWDLQMKALKKTFRRSFPLYDKSPNATETVSTFQGGSVDFGDHLLYETVMRAPQNKRCVFSNDGDFYAFPDELHLLTTNGEIIRTAKKDGKLY